MIYLNYAALCSMRPEVQQEIEISLAEFQSLLYSEAGLDWYRKKIRSCRQDVADVLNVSDPLSIAFVPNASMASHLALSFIDWQPGDIILTSTHENPSILREIQWLAHRGVGVSMINLASPHDLLTTIDSYVSTQPIKAIVLSHVSHVDGRVLPVSEIGRMAKKGGTLFLLDGAQAVGHIPTNLDQLDFDLYFFPGHKWCRGPLGTGALVMRKQFLTQNAAFTQAGLGWNETLAGRMEIGTHNIGLIAGFATACTLLHAEGLKLEEKGEIRETVSGVLGKLGSIRIPPWEGEHAPGILTFQCQDTQTHLTIRDDFQAGEPIVVKQFLDYPEGETPAIRLSWIGQEDRANVSLAVKTVRHALNIS